MRNGAAEWGEGREDLSEILLKLALLWSLGKNLREFSEEK